MTPSLPLVRISRNLSVLSYAEIGHIFETPLPLSAYVLNGSPLTWEADERDVIVDVVPAPGLVNDDAAVSRAAGKVSNRIGTSSNAKSQIWVSTKLLDHAHIRVHMTFVVYK